MNKLLPPKNTPHIIEHPIVAAITSEIKGVHGLTTYWRESIRAQRDKEVFEFLQQVSSKITEIYMRQLAHEETEGGRIDLKHLDSDEFKCMMAKTCECVVREGDEAKRIYLVDFMVNYAKENRPDVTVKQLYFSILDRLTGAHVILLKALYDRQYSLSDYDLRALSHQPERPEMLSLATATSEFSMDPGILELVMHTCETAGLIEIINAPNMGTDRSERLLLRPVGKSLMKFLLGQWD